MDLYEFIHHIDQLKPRDKHWKNLGQGDKLKFVAKAFVFALRQFDEKLPPCVQEMEELLRSEHAVIRFLRAEFDWLSLVDPHMKRDVYNYVAKHLALDSRCFSCSRPPQERSLQL